MSRQVSACCCIVLNKLALRQDCDAAVSETPMPMSRMFSLLSVLSSTGAGRSTTPGADRITEDSQSSGRR